MGLFFLSYYSHYCSCSLPFLISDQIISKLACVIILKLDVLQQPSSLYNVQ